MDTEGSNISTSLAWDPEDTHITLLVVLNKLKLVDVSDSEFLLDSRDQRRSLEASTSQWVESLLELLGLVKFSVKFDNSDVLLTSWLLSLNESGGVVDASNEATSDLGVEGTRVTSLVNLEDLLYPGNDLVGGGVWWLIKVDHTVVLKGFDGALGGRETAGKGSEVGCLDV